MDKPALPEFEIFRAGTHTAVDGTKVTMTLADLAAIAAGYTPDRGEAPLVLGHPKLNAPAYGWVDSLRVEGGTLLARPKQVDLAFAALVNDGKYKKRSASFFLPDSPGNPTPGQLYLRHVGFLGAAVPGLPGLKDVSFAAEEKVVEFASARPWWVFGQVADLFRRLRDRMIESDGIEAADAALPDWQLNSLREAADMGRDADGESALAFAAPELEPAIETPPTVDDDAVLSTDHNQQATADFAARENEISEREQAIAARETALRDREAHAKRTGVVEFASALVQAGRLLPRQQPAVVELLCSLDAEPHALSFAAADGETVERSGAAVMRELLEQLPVQVDMAERGAGEDLSNAVEFAAPAGVVADRHQLELLGKARAYQQQHPGTSLVAAVQAVGGH